MSIPDQILSKEHRAAGMYLSEDDHNLFLMMRGQVCPLAVWNAYVVDIKSVIHEADQHLNWAKSGIEFGEAQKR